MLIESSEVEIVVETIMQFIEQLYTFIGGHFVKMKSPVVVKDHIEQVFCAF